MSSSVIRILSKSQYFLLGFRIPLSS
uniref:Uncharacterized protein n=1 Tax=Heterorhabditis bacteriophora TaxID=37862 RepID=A0A1I7X151_HETBA